MVVFFLGAHANDHTGLRAQLDVGKENFVLIRVLEVLKVQPEQFFAVIVVLHDVEVVRAIVQLNLYQVRLGHAMQPFVIIHYPVMHDKELLRLDGHSILVFFLQN